MTQADTCTGSALEHRRKCLCLWATTSQMSCVLFNISLFLSIDILFYLPLLYEHCLFANAKEN